MDQILYLSLLFDFYGALLTDKQQECLRLHLFEDLSLSEIAGELGISRQAVHDNIHRAERAMAGYEEKLGLVARYARERSELSAIAEELAALRTADNGARIDALLARLSPLLGEQEAGA